MTGGERVFVSYSRKDGAEFAADLRQRLLKEDLSVWQDIIALEGGRDWWSQVEDALKSKLLQHFVLVVTAAALESPVIRREIRLARQEGKTVSPVKGPGLGDLGQLPRWLGQIYDLDLPEHRTTLMRVLRDQSRQKRVAMMAPELPPDFVQRPAEFNTLKRRLLDARGDAVAITAALRGAGGYGKTTLAQALGNDPDIVDAYFDGVLWVELGEKPEAILPNISDLITRLTGVAPGLETINAAASALSDALGDRRILMVIDDVWREGDLLPFLRGGPNTTRLITTRLGRVVPAQAFRQPVDAMKQNEAHALLSWGLPEDQVVGQASELGHLAARLGEWAQLLKLVNGFLRDRVLEGSEALRQAISDADSRLTEEGLDAFDADDENDRTRAVARTINVSAGLLDEKQRARFTELAVFPEDTDVPLGIVIRLWRETAKLGRRQTTDLLVRFYGLSLLRNLDLDRSTFRLHDTIRHFLRDQAGEEGQLAQHRSLVTALDGSGESIDADVQAREYYFMRLPYHLSEAKDRTKLDALLLDPGWLNAKLTATGSPQALIADYDLYGVNDTQSVIGRTLRLSAGICTRDPRQLIPQLICRLMASEAVASTNFLESAYRYLTRPAILTVHLSLAPPGAEIARLEGHSGSVRVLSILPDGRLASSADDGTIRLWDVNRGVETAQLEGVGHALCVLPDGRLAAGSPRSIQFWDVKSDIKTDPIIGDVGEISALCMLADGRLAASAPGIITFWDVKTGAKIGELEGVWGELLCALPMSLWDQETRIKTILFKGHQDPIRALCRMPDGRLLSASGERTYTIPNYNDNTVRLWDIETGAQSLILKGHASMVNALCALPNGRLASGSDDRTIRLWDARTGAQAARLDGHLGPVNALCTLANGWLASGSDDRTIRLWDVNTAIQTTQVDGHSDSINALCVLCDDLIASAAGDATIRLWDVKSGTQVGRLDGHWDSVNALCLLPDGRLASASGEYWSTSGISRKDSRRGPDNTIRLWNLKTTTEVAQFKGYWVRREGIGNWLVALSVLSDGRLVSLSDDGTIQLWDVGSGIETARSSGATCLCALPDGRLASGNGRLWDVRDESKAARLTGLEDSANALCMTQDGRLASGSDDGIIRLWDLRSTIETAQLHGPSSPVNALCALPNGRLVSGSSDHTIRLWDIATGREIARLEVDAPVRCLAALPDGRLIAGDGIGRLHWLAVLD
ncbi:MAG: TIR domain-containing protein [Xanthobacteraceae bacterium]